MQAMNFFIFWFLVPLLEVFGTKITPFEVKKVTNESLNKNVSTRIFGGNEASDGQFKYMIFMLMKYRGDFFRCSASLIHPEWVLLAAHCILPFVTARDIKMVGGRSDIYKYVMEKITEDFYRPIDETKHGLQERTAIELYEHPNFDINTFDNDVALIKVDKPFLGPLVLTIPISYDKIRQKKSCMILGWGLTHRSPSLTLNYAEGVEISTTSLGCNYKNEGAFICLIGHDHGIREGDSGSPLICDGRVWGVASHYVYDSQGEPLEEYYTEINEQLKWINSVYNTGTISKTISMKALIIGLCFALWTTKH